MSAVDELIAEIRVPAGPGDFTSPEDEADYWRHMALRAAAALSAAHTVIEEAKAALLPASEHQDSVTLREQLVAILSKYPTGEEAE